MINISHQHAEHDNSLNYSQTKLPFYGYQTIIEPITETSSFAVSIFHFFPHGAHDAGGERCIASNASDSNETV